MKEFEVQCDITFSGSLYIEAETEEEAKIKAKNMRIVPSDIRNFYHFTTEVTDVILP